MAGTTKRATSFRLSEEAIALIEGLSGRLGLSQAGVVEMSVRLLAEQVLPPRGTAAVRPDVPDLAAMGDHELNSFTQQMWSYGNRPAFEAVEREWERRGKGHVPGKVKETFPTLGWRDGE